MPGELGDSGGWMASTRARARDVAGRIRDWFDETSTRARRAEPVVDLCWELWARFRQRNGSVLVGHVAYRVFLWITPLALVLLVGLGVSTSTFDVIRYAEEYGANPDSFSDTLADAERSQIAALLFGLTGLIAASWSLVRGIHYAYAQAWGITISPRRHTIRGSLVATGAALAVAALLVVIGTVQRQGAIFAFLGWAGTWLLALAAIWIIQWTMPNSARRFWDLLPGSVFGAVGMSLMNLFAAVYLPGRFSSAAALYGAFGTVIAVLFYLFLGAYLLVLAPFVNSVWVDREEILRSRPWAEESEAPALLANRIQRVGRRLSRVWSRRDTQ